MIQTLAKGSLNANDESSIIGTGRKQISDINMLLPVSSCETCRKVSYQISAINGCYSWEVSHPNLIELERIPSDSHPECSNVALAYDEEGNLFSGLNGYRFDWNIESGNQNVKVVSWREASRAHSELSSEFELNKLQSEVFFLKGIKQGTSVVTVKLNEPGYEGVDQSMVVLTITEPFVIIPQQTVYILPTSKYHFKLSKVTLSDSDMSFTPITLPNKQYSWNVDNSDKGTINDDGVFISKDKEGFAQILVIDQNIANNTAESSIIVAFPQLIDVEISDITKQLVEDKLLLVDASQKSFQDQLSINLWDNNLILVQEHYYFFKINLYDGDKHKIHLSDNIVIKNAIDSEYFDIIKVNKINSEIIVKAKKPTPKNQKLVYVSTLVQIKSENPKLSYTVDQTRLRTEKEIIVTENVKVNHPTDLILLPLLRNPIDENHFGEIWQLSAIGGSGYYQWQILDDRIAQISGSGVLRSVEVGTTTVLVRDSLNQRNYHTIKVEVAPIASFSWLEDHVEVKKNVEQAVLNIIALDKLGRKFTNCSSIELSFELKGAGIISNIPSPKRYENVQNYVSQNKYIINLKQRFDENPSANFIGDLPSQTKQREDIMLHNNFGICSQQTYAAIGEGLARVKAHFVNQISIGSSQILESPYAEIASYDSLVSRHPNYEGFFNDLQSKTGQKFDESAKYFQENTFNLAFGSSIQWIVTGGTNFWKDVPEKYQSKVIIQVADKKLDNNVLKPSLQIEQTSYFQYELLCQKPNYQNLQKPHDFTVALKQNNQVSKYLLRPAQHEVAIRVVCEPPKSVEFYWSQENRTLSQQHMSALPLYRIINQEKHNFVLANSDHYLRYLMFDSSNQVFYNHSSILTEVSPSDQKMAKVSLVNNSYAEAVVDNRYDVRKVSFLGQTGTVYINAVPKGYYTRGYSESEGLNLPYEIKAKLRVEVVNNVNVQPKYKSVYLHKDNRYTLRILDGSGKFSVTLNNTEVADKSYIDGERVITIIPKKEGPLSVRVEDLEIPDSQVSVTEILISDISRLELDVPGTLIEQGSSMEMNVTAFDTYGQQFDDDQYKLMKFAIEIEISQQREKGLSTEIDSFNNRRFVAKGVEPGNYQVNAVTMKFSLRPDIEKLRVSSELQKIEVFPLLEISPGNLLLTPSMRYTLQILGGPSRSISSISTQTGSVEIRFDIENKRIATVDQFREITANEVGDTNLYYEIIQIRSGRGDFSRRSIISKKTVPIRVRLVTGIDIPYNDQRTVYSGSMIKMFAILKHNDETFTHGIAPISYNWNSTNQNVLALNLPNKFGVGESASNALATTVARNALVVFQNKKIRDNENNNNNAVFLSHFNSSTVYTTGGKSGEALVTVQLAIEYPEIYKSSKNWFSKSVTLRVKEKLKVDIPEFINNPEKQTHLYLMPPNSYSKIETNKRTRLRLGYSQQSVYDYSTNSYQYKEVQTPIISLVNEEGIRTFDKYGKVTVIIEENQAFSDQVVMLNVLITDIFTVISKDVYQTLNFPLGSSMNIPLKFQNEHGHSFANNIEGIEVGIELSHPRVLTASLNEFNSTLSLKAEGSGECNVIVYLLKQPQIYDIFKVRVQSVVKPLSPVNVHVGGEITFKIMNEDQQVTSDDIIWSSSNPSIIDINQKTGQARSLNEGKIDILLSNNINAASIVHSSKVKLAEVDQASRKNLVINTDDYQGEVRIRIKLYLQDQIEELTPTVQYDGVTLIRQNVGLLCQSDNPDVLNARAEINDIEGYFCVLTYNKVGDQIPISSQVQVSAYAPNPKAPRDIKQALYVEKLLSFEVTYQSKIRVESKFARGLRLYGDQRSAQVNIFSNTKFDIRTENYAAEDLGQDLLKLRVDLHPEDPTRYTLSVVVPQEITHEFKSDIILTHPKTQVQTKIPISFENAQKKPQARKETPTPQKESAKREITVTGEQKGLSVLGQYFLIGLLIVSVFCYFIVNIFNVDPVNFLRDLLSLRNPFNQRPAQQPQRQLLSQQSAVRQSALMSSSQISQYPRAQSSFMSGSQRPIVGAPGVVNRPKASNLGGVNMSYDSAQKQPYPSVYTSRHL